ncbi:hypothetical protein J6TS7_20800 [Paenibacillus dendritiformis]|nr:hypothetical protein J6TS7_20800 [Paenibacillus dendritiformis]
MNSGIKLIFWIYFLVLLAITGFYIQHVFNAEDVISRALGPSIDGGIIHGTISSDTGRGGVRLDEARVRQGIVMLMRKNLGLDASLSSDTFRNGRLEIVLTHNSEGVPRVEAVYSAEIEIGIMRLVGQDGYTIRVPKKTPYLTEYK